MGNETFKEKSREEGNRGRGGQKIPSSMKMNNGTGRRGGLVEFARTERGWGHDKGSGLMHESGTWGSVWEIVGISSILYSMNFMFARPCEHLFVWLPCWGVVRSSFLANNHCYYCYRCCFWQIRSHPPTRWLRALCALFFFLRSRKLPRFLFWFFMIWQTVVIQ